MGGLFIMAKIIVFNNDTLKLKRHTLNFIVYVNAFIGYNYFFYYCFTYVF